MISPMTGHVTTGYIKNSGSTAFAFRDLESKEKPAEFISEYYKQELNFR